MNKTADQLTDGDVIVRDNRPWQFKSRKPTRDGRVRITFFDPTRPLDELSFVSPTDRSFELIQIN